MVNENIYCQVKATFKKRGVQVSEYDFSLYAKMFEILVEVTHEKLWLNSKVC